VQLAVEPLREGELLRIGERLVAEHQDGVGVHPRSDGRERPDIVHRAQVDGADLGGEERVERTEGQGHARTVPDRVVMETA
jgi:hypothetical protein